MDRSIVAEIPESAEDRKRIGELYRAIAAVLLADDGKPGGDVLIRAPAAEASAAASAPAPAAGATPPATAAEMDEATVRWLLTEITPNARRFLRANADEVTAGNGPTSTTLRARFNVSSVQVMAGWAASIGFALKRLKLPRPYSQNWEYTENGWENRYSMDLGVAEKILSLVEEDGTVADAQAG